MRKARLVGAIACCFVLTACTTSVMKLATKWVRPSELALVNLTFTRAAAGDWNAIRGSLHESGTGPTSDSVWSQIADTLKGADFAARKLIGVNVNVNSGRRSVVMTYEGPATDQWYVVSVGLLEGRLYGFRVAREKQSLVSANAFRMSDIGLSHLLMLALGLVSIGLACLASYRVLTSTMRRQKLWAVLPFVMIGDLTLNWTNGAVDLHLVTLQLPPITFIKTGPAAPWIFGFGLPVFALIALLKVRRANAASATELVVDDMEKEQTDRVIDT